MVQLSAGKDAVNQAFFVNIWQRETLPLAKMDYEQCLASVVDKIC